VRPFVVVEGVNGAGKSTLVERLAGALGAASFHFPPAFVHFRQAARLDERVGARARLGYYLGATLHLAELVTVARGDGPVVCDRYLAGPLSLLEAEGSLAQADLDRLVSPWLDTLPRPDVTLLLLVPHAVAASRLNQRGVAEPTPVEARTLASPAFLAARERALARWSERLGPVVTVDASGPADATFDAAWAALPPAIIATHPTTAVNQ
jgi:thymidylate kinase